MVERQEVILYVCIDSSGDYAIGTDADIAREAYDSKLNSDLVRTVRQIGLSVPIPEEYVDHSGPAIVVADEPAPEAVTA